MDFPDRRSGYGVEADQRAGWYHDLPAILFRSFDEVFVVEKRASAKHDGDLSAGDKRSND